jgi:hypothetical protein
MPKEEINYSNTIIYKIFCKDLNIKDIYVGHTTNFIKRKYKHKKSCNDNNNKLKIYEIINKNGGWNNWEIVEIAKYNCKDHCEARIKEQEHYQLLNAIKITDFKEHNLHEKQISTISTKKVYKKSQKYFCEKCNYTTSYNYQYDKHLLTHKHKNNEKSTIFQHLSTNKNIKSDTTYNCECGKKYKERTGLWRHKKKCSLTNAENTNDNLQITDEHLIKLLINQCKELRNENKELIEIIKQNSNNIVYFNNNNSNNKTFNLNLFLNETCKNAMNLTEFVDSLKIQLSDLENVGKLGYVEGISNIIIKNLKELDVTQRPVHCTDKKREILYIKNENKWEKDDEQKKNLRNAIKKIASKNQRVLPQFKEKYPDCNTSVSMFSDQYNKIIIETMGGFGDNDLEKENKIIRKIVKEVIIDKND